MWSFASGSSCNFAGIIGKNIFRIENGILQRYSMTLGSPHMEYSFDQIKPVMINQEPNRVSLEIIAPQISVSCPEEMLTELTIRDKFVSQCSIEELLVAVQAKLNGM